MSNNMLVGRNSFPQIDSNSSLDNETCTFLYFSSYTDPETRYSMDGGKYLSNISRLETLLVSKRETKGLKRINAHRGNHI